MAITWNALLSGLKQFEKAYRKLDDSISAYGKLSDKDKEVISKLAIEAACNALGCTPKEIDLLSSAFASNAHWILSGIRDKELAKACENANVFRVMRKLFVNDNVVSIGFVTRTYYIKRKLSDGGRGLSWDGSQRIVRIRKNRIMNWATDASALCTSFTNNEPVLLVPVADISSSIVFCVGPKLLATCGNYSEAYAKVRKLVNRSVAVDFWGDLYALCHAVDTMQNERECFTYGERVPCNVFRLDNQGDKARHPMHAPRLPV